MLDDEETGLVEQLLRRSNRARGSSDDEADEEEEGMIGQASSDALRGARHGSSRSGGPPGGAGDASGFPRYYNWRFFFFCCAHLCGSEFPLATSFAVCTRRYIGQTPPSKIHRSNTAVKDTTFW